MTTTILGETIASSSVSRATQLGSARDGSSTGHFTHSVPYTASGSMFKRFSDFISAFPVRP